MRERRVDPEAMRVGEMAFPLPTAALGRANPASHLGSTIKPNLLAEVQVSRQALGVRA